MFIGGKQAKKNKNKNHSMTLAANSQTCSVEFVALL